MNKEKIQNILKKDFLYPILIFLIIFFIFFDIITLRRVYFGAMDVTYQNLPLFY
jgi:hypothetical protein